MAHFSRWIAALLFCLLLSGVLLAPTRAQGYSTPPASVAGAPALVPTNLHYTLRPDDPTRIHSVAFALTAPVAEIGTIHVRLASTSQTWYRCAPSRTTWQCETADAPAVATVEQIEVRVVQ